MCANSVTSSSSASGGLTTLEEAAADAVTINNENCNPRPVLSVSPPISESRPVHLHGPDAQLTASMVSKRRRGAVHAAFGLFHAVALTNG